MASKLLIKNMVCDRCIMSVKDILHKHNVPFENITLGEVDLTKKVSDSTLDKLRNSLSKVGFELIESRVNKLVDDIKQRVLEYLSLGMDSQNTKLSDFIIKKINYDYSYLSDLFSSIEGKTIEQFFILQRIEKVKELIVYDQLSFTEISYQTGFSSVHHLSSQFKKVTGLSPTHFKKVAEKKRRPVDKV